MIPSIFIKFGRQVNHEERRNPIDLQGQRLKWANMEITLWEPLRSFLSHLAWHKLSMMGGITLLIFKVKGKGMDVSAY